MVSRMVRVHEAPGSSPGTPTIGSIAQLGEHLPYKQGVTGSSPVGPSYFLKFLALRCEELADVAQLAEQLICNQQVIGSSPIIGFIWMGSRAAKGGRL